MRLTRNARVAVAACAAITALVLTATSNADARPMRGGGHSAQSGGSNVMGPGGNGPVVNGPATPTWQNNQGGLIGGVWPGPKRHPCTTPNSPVPGYYC